MNNRIHYSYCPVCGSASIHEVMKVKDHSVSQETFALFQCSECTLRFTQDVPGPASISAYYKSEDYISHTNTSKGFINRLYLAVRKRTMEAKRKLIEQNTGLTKGKLLDIGSGTGTFARYMGTYGWQVTGLEPDPGARAVALRTYQVELGDMDRFYSLPPGNFQAITLWHVLEHVHDLHPYMQQLKKVLIRDGKLFVAVPNYTSGDAKAYENDWAAYDVPRHLYHFSPRSMEVLAEKNGLKIENYKPMWFDSFYISLLSSKYRKGKPKIISAFLQGLRSNFQAWTNVKKCSSVIYIISK
jgi:SAM-dependent methyltransferase